MEGVLRLLRQRRQVVVEVGRERIEIRGAAGGIAEAVQHERDLTQSKGGVEVPCECDDLGVDRRVIGAKRLDAYLAELAITTCLGPLITELGAFVPDLPRDQRAVLDKRTNHRGGQLWAQRVPLAILGFEVVHLLRDDIGCLAEPLEDAQVLEHRRHDMAIPCTPGGFAKRVDERALAIRLTRENISGAFWGLKSWLRHGLKC